MVCPMVRPLSLAFPPMGLLAVLIKNPNHGILWSWCVTCVFSTLNLSLSRALRKFLTDSFNRKANAFDPITPIMKSSAYLTKRTRLYWSSIGSFDGSCLACFSAFAAVSKSCFFRALYAPLLNLWYGRFAERRLPRLPLWLGPCTDPFHDRKCYSTMGLWRRLAV